MTTVTINNHEQCYVEQMMLINQGLGPPKKRGLIRRTAGTIGGAIGGGIKGTLGGGIKGAVTGGVGGAVLGGPAAPVTGALGAAAGGVGGGIIGGIRGMGKGIRHGARKYATPKVIYNEKHPMRTIVTVNNRDQLAVEQQMLVNQLVDNGLLSAGRKIIRRSRARFMAGAKGMKAGLVKDIAKAGYKRGSKEGFGRVREMAASAKKSGFGNKLTRGAQLAGGAAGGAAGHIAKHKAAYGVGAAAAGAAGGGTAVALSGRRKNK